MSLRRLAPSGLSVILFIAACAPVVRPPANAMMALDQPVRSAKFQALLPDVQPDGPWEGSGVDVRGERAYIIFDDFDFIADIHIDLEDLASNKVHHQGSGGNGFEGITCPENAPCYVISEGEAVGWRYFGRIYAYDPDFTTLPISWWTQHEFRKENKGFEGLTLVERAGEQYLLGLCEGNYCETDRAADRGHGRIIVMKAGDGLWNTIAEMRIPREVAFLDFAGMDIQGNRLALVSQASSLLWVGTMDIEAWSIRPGGQLYTFPTGPAGRIEYCNVEGVAWLGENQVMIVNDEEKGTQRSYCDAKSEAIDIFDLEAAQ